METSKDKSSVVWSGRPAWSSYILLWVFVSILAIRGLFSIRFQAWSSVLFHLVAIALLSMIAILLRQTAHYRVTREGVYRSTGFSGKSEQAFLISTIDSVSERSGPLERLFGIGDVVLHLKDGTNERLSGIKDPEIVSNKIKALL